jgi:carbamoyl-phosphate synthase large subunit
MSVRILVTCVGGSMVPDLLTHLRTDAILQPYLIGVDSSPNVIGRAYVDAFYQTPIGEDVDYVKRMLQIVRQEKVNIILPYSDQEAFVLADAREEFAKLGATVLVSPPLVLALIKDKVATYRALEAAGLYVPPYLCVGCVKELKEAFHKFGYPTKSVIVKPISGRGGRGMRLLVGRGEHPPKWIGSGAREVRLDVLPEQKQIDIWFRDGALMVMPMLDSPAYDVDVLAIQGKAKAALVRKRSNPAGIPFTGNHIVANPSIVEYCLNIAEALGLDALHDIDLLTDQSGQPCLLEVNPRPSGSVCSAHAAGFPIVAAAIAEKLRISYPLNVPTGNVCVGVVSRATVMAQSESSD